MNSLKEKYRKKSSNYYNEVRKDILPLIPPNLNRVLEIGCGTGSTLYYLKSNGYCNWTCGVDLFQDAVDSARDKLDEVHQANIEERSLSIEPGSIDMILCLDVLEHLINPQDTVAYLHTLLSPNGVIIASIPNVRHHSVLLPLLLLNRWEYKEQGVLDNTHLRFFVKSTAIELMKSSGLCVSKVLNRYGVRDTILNYVSFGLLKSFFSIQTLIKVDQNNAN
jgi:2-polyprenyl-3-methyl-5-hydroxy-6-metoxy-1,4-benzoquinol methylase